MKIVYCVWLLSRDERALRFVCGACIALASVCFLLARVPDRATPAQDQPAFPRFQATTDSRLISP
jgi:hypothetical protein